jgi:hypothetical protein
MIAVCELVEVLVVIDITDALGLVDVVPKLAPVRPVAMNVDELVNVPLESDWTNPL